MESRDSDFGIRFGEVADSKFSYHDFPTFRQSKYTGVKSGVEDEFSRGRSRAIKACTMSKVEVIKSKSHQVHDISRRTVQEAFDEAVTTNTDKTSTRTQTQPRQRTRRPHTQPRHDTHIDSDAFGPRRKSFGPRPDVSINVSSCAPTSLNQVVVPRGEILPSGGVRVVSDEDHVGSSPKKVRNPGSQSCGAHQLSVAAVCLRSSLSPAAGCMCRTPNSNTLNLPDGTTRSRKGKEPGTTRSRKGKTGKNCTGYREAEGTMQELRNLRSAPRLCGRERFQDVSRQTH